MRLSICTILVIMLVLSAASADSIFDVRGAGKDVIPVAGSTRAMGGATAASRDPLDCALSNPFASALTKGVTITAGFAHTSTRTDNLGEEERTVTTLFPTITAIIPFKGVAFMTGLYQEKEGRLSLALADSAYGSGYDFDYRRETSVHSAPLYISARLHKRLVASAGILFSALDIRETHRLDFRSGDRTDARDAIDISARGQAFAAGLQVDLDVVQIAALFRGKADLDGDLERQSRYSEVWNTLDVSVTSEESYRFGVRVKPHSYVALEVDYEKSPWSTIETDDEVIADRDVHRWSAGLEYRGEVPWDAAKYPLFAGYYRQPLDWDSPLTGEIIEQVFSVGTSIPIATDRAAVALSLEFGQRDAQNRADLAETFYGISVSISAVEVWRREIRTRP